MNVDNKAMARVDRLVELGVLFNAVYYRPGKIPPRFTTKLEEYRLPLRAMQDGGEFHDIAGKHIEIIDCLLAYARTGDRTLVQLGREKYKEVTVMLNKLREKVRNDGV